MSQQQSETMDSPTMTQAAFARRCGVARKTVTVWRRRGFLHLTADGQVDAAASLAMLAERPEAYRGGRLKPIVTGNAGVKRELLSDGELNTFAAMERIRREREEQASGLPAAAEAAGRMAADFAAVRAALAIVPRDLAPQLVALQDAADIEARIGAALEQALSHPPGGTKHDKP